MPSNKDLVDAQSFNRRRLVSAFVGGAPGGREPEPRRPGRTLVGGLALAVLVGAGGLIAGWYTDQPDSDWLEPGLIISDNGTRYVITEKADPPVLHRVPNYATALLLLGPEPETSMVSDDRIDEQEVGPDLGILGAPDSVPAPESLVDDGWAACTEDGTGVRATVSPSPGVTELPAEAAFVVRSGDEHWLIGRAPQALDDAGPGLRYRLPSGGQRLATVLDRLGLGQVDDVAQVPQGWLELFAEGTPLSDDAIGVPRGGRPGYGDLPRGSRVGDLVEFDGRSYLLAEDGAVALSDFQRQLVLGLRGRAPVEVGSLPTSSAELPEDWPTAMPVPQTGELCARLLTRDGEQPAVLPAGSPTEDVYAAQVPVDAVETQVASDHGALVRVADGGAGTGADAGSEDTGPDGSGTGEAVLIDAQGIAYPLADADTAERLGYTDEQLRGVPASWLALFHPGVELSVERAGEPVEVPQP